MVGQAVHEAEPRVAASAVALPAPASATAAPSRVVRLRGRTYPVFLPQLRDPRLHVAVVTITLHVLGQLGLGFHVSVPQILAAIVTCAAIEAVVTFRQTNAFVWPASAMLTGSGIALILRVTTTPPGDHWTFHGWWVFAGVAAFSLATKYLVRYQGQPIFNPSNVGLVVAFIVLGSSRVEPLDFWWSPLDTSMFLAYAVILVGGCLITYRLHLLAGALTFWGTLAAGSALLASTGHCMTARWAFAPVCGTDYWRAIVTSPEVMVFMFFMITDPKTVPRGRVGHVLFCFLVAVASLLLMAPQTTEFWSKVGLLGGLVIVCALRPLLERILPTPGAHDDHLRPFVARHTVARPVGTPAAVPVLRTGAVLLAGVALTATMLVAGVGSRGVAVADASDILSRQPSQVNPATLPEVTVEQGVLDWNHEISGAGAQAIVLTLVENLELENRALRDRDVALLQAVAHGDRLDAMQQRLESAESGRTELLRYQIDNVHVRLLIPFGKQDGLSLGLESRGTVTTEIYDAGGNRVDQFSEPFETMWALRRVTGDRWMTVGEMPPGSDG